MTKFQFCELSVSKQRPRNNQTVIGGNEHYDTLIILETQDSQIPENNEQENGETDDSFLYDSEGVTNGTAPDFASKVCRV